MIALSAPIDLNYSKLNYTAMKHFNLLKTLLLLCALIVGSLSSWATDIVVTLDNIGAGIDNSANTTASTTNITATGTTDSYALNYYQCKKQGNAMLMVKNVSPYISNHTAMPGNIKSVEVFINSGAAKATTYNCAFSTTECNTATSGIGAVNITGGNSHVFSNLSGETIKVNGKYFCVTLGNSNNGQVLKLVITCEASDPSDTRSDAGISFAETGIVKTWGDSFTGQLLRNPNSVDVTYSSTDESVATVSSTGVVTMVKAGSTTIKATFAGDATYKAAVASYDLTINKANANLSYDETVFDVDLNDNSFVAPTLNNPNGLTVTYTSSDEDIAVVDDNTGELLLVTTAEGTVKITASFTGNDNYNAGSAKYTINIIDQNKKGSKLNPYTVAEVREVSTTTTIKDVYVEGYIVGYVNSTYGFTSSTSSFTNTNWAIADSKNETEADNSAPVQITGTSIQSLYGLANHKDLVGAKVLIKGDITKYFNVSGIKNLDEFNVEKEIAISAAGWATYCSSNALDFTGVTALTAYTATKDGNVVKFNKVTGKVPANTGLLVKGETANVPVCASAEAVSNLLVGVTTDTPKDAGTIFVLMKGSKGIGFYKNTNAFTLRANSAYLPAEAVAGASARSFIALDDETTGIADVKAVKEDTEGMFDLQGRKIAKPTKGLYIVNGKKVVVK